jgi:DNA-binding XRE family transcriptional regulator
MADTSTTRLRAARDRLGIGREKVAAKLDPPISSKTLERWETPGYKVPLWRLRQLADQYEVDVDELLERSVAA